MNSRIEDLNMANPFGKPPVNINVHESAFQAFLQLCTEKVRALAVLNDQGQVVGTLSASDLRGFDSEQLPKLNKPSEYHIFSFFSKKEEIKHSKSISSRICKRSGRRLYSSYCS